MSDFKAKMHQNRFQLIWFCTPDSTAGAHSAVEITNAGNQNADGRSAAEAPYNIVYRIQVPAVLFLLNLLIFDLYGPQQPGQQQRLVYVDVIGILCGNCVYLF